MPTIIADDRAARKRDLATREAEHLEAEARRARAQAAHDRRRLATVSVMAQAEARAVERSCGGAVERGAVFHFLGGQANFFLILVVISLAAGVLLLQIAGRLCHLMHGRG